MVELKRKCEEDMANNEALEEYKKRAAREMDQMQAQLHEARTNADRMDKTRKKLQTEVIAICCHPVVSDLVFSSLLISFRFMLPGQHFQT